jgi:cysteine desulfurase
MTGSAPIYFDYNATAPLLPAALERMQAAVRDYPGNPSSPHAFGQAARDALESARTGVASRLGCSRRELTFTSGGSEANNTVFRAVAEGARPAHVITSPIEHPSILRCCDWLRAQGVAVSYLPVDDQGVVAVDAVEGMLRPETRLISLMAANNETGVIQPLQRLAEIVRQAAGGRAILLHSDAVQAFGRMPLPIFSWGYDAVTVAAHKLGGPKGIGALALRRPEAVPALILGGRQERDRRAGTESVALAQGFLAATEWVWEQGSALPERLARLRDRLVERLSTGSGFFLNGAGAPRLPNTASVGFEEVSAQSLLVAADLRGVAVSTGSACSSGAMEPSHVLRAMGLAPGRVAASLRISLGWASTEQEVERAADILLAEADRLRARGQGRRAQGG